MGVGLMRVVGGEMRKNIIYPSTLTNYEGGVNKGCGGRYEKKHNIFPHITLHLHPHNEGGGRYYVKHKRGDMRMGWGHI